MNKVPCNIELVGHSVRVPVQAFGDHALEHVNMSKLSVMLDRIANLSWRLKYESNASIFWMKFIQKLPALFQNSVDINKIWKKTKLSEKNQTRLFFFYLFLLGFLLTLLQTALILPMVIILDGNSEPHAWWKIGLIRKKIRFVTSLDLIKCLKQIK